MKKVKDLSLDKLQLSSYDESLFRRLSMSFEDVVMLVRVGDFPPFYNTDKMVEYRTNVQRAGLHHYETREMNRLAYDVWKSLERLGAIRHDFYDSERFRKSANIVALQEAIEELHGVTEEQLAKPLHYYLCSDEYVVRLIRKLNNETYEEWEGFSDESIKQILALIEGSLSETDFAIICMKFGLDLDTRCKSLDEIATEFGWTTNAVRYHLRRSIFRLYYVLDILKFLTKIKL